METTNTAGKQSVASRCFAGAIVLMTAVGMYVMIARRNDGPLAARGLAGLRYFTADSNLLVGLVNLVLLFSGRVRLWLERLVYIAAVAVSLTFVVVVCVFAPFLGLAPLVRDANLYFHLIVPVLAIASFCLCHRNRPIPLRETALALIPSVLYGIYYTAVLLVRGVHFPFTDWYGFAAGGVVGSVITAAGILLLTWVLALLLRFAAGGTARQARRREN